MEEKFKMVETEAAKEKKLRVEAEAAKEKLRVEAETAK